MSRSIGRAFIGIAAVIILIALMLSGTYAWQEKEQHKTGEAENTDSYHYDIRLIEESEEITDWKISDGLKTKRLFVSNLGELEEGFQPYYVRLTVKEFMEISTVYYDEETAELVKELPYSLIPEIERADTGNETDECAYPSTVWREHFGEYSNTLPFRRYVSWKMGDDCISLSEYLEMGSPAVEKWIYNDQDPDDTYVYWGQALSPGEKTSDLMEGVQLVVQPEGCFYYAIHADLEAASLEELIGATPVWVENPIIDGYVKQSGVEE